MSLLPLPRLRRVRYFYVSATVRLPISSRRLCYNEGHGLVYVNRHVLPAALGQAILPSCLRSNRAHTRLLVPLSLIVLAYPRVFFLCWVLLCTGQAAGHVRLLSHDFVRERLNGFCRVTARSVLLLLWPALLVSACSVASFLQQSTSLLSALRASTALLVLLSLALSPSLSISLLPSRRHPSSSPSVPGWT